MRNTLYQQALETSSAIKLIELGARLQLLEIEFNISREMLLNLYKEINGDSPPKGMLPFSADWFLTWQPNIHSSLFMAYYQFFKRNAEITSLELLIKSYEMYLEEVSRHRNHDKKKPMLSITRAWTMLRMMNNGHPMLKMTECVNCGGLFVVRTDESLGYYKNFKCGFCHMPARAGKLRQSFDEVV